MTQGLEQLMESGVLTEEVKLAIAEAWNLRIQEIKEKAEHDADLKLREEYAQRFKADKDQLVEALDLMITETLKPHIDAHASEAKKLKNERAELAKSVVEARKDAKRDFESRIQKIEESVLKELTFYVSEHAKQVQENAIERVKLAKLIQENRKNNKTLMNEKLSRMTEIVYAQLENQTRAHYENINKFDAVKKVAMESLIAHKQKINEDTAKRINQFENFVLDILKDETRGLKEDHERLIEAQVKLASESKKQLEETKKAFVERASKMLEETNTRILTREIKNLKTEIQEARESLFGQRIFEAFQAEFLASHLSEGSKMKTVMNELSEVKTKLAEATSIIAQKDILVESVSTKAKAVEEKAKRITEMNRLLRPLTSEKREIMESLLRTVPTQNLDTQFRRYLPKILNETVNKTEPKRVLNEENLVAVTGDKQTTKNENVQDNTLIEIAELRRLAGLK